MLAVLQEEGISCKPLTPAAFTAEIDQTLLCFVLTARRTVEHAFCSAYDFGPWPLLPNVSELEAPVLQVCNPGIAVIHRAGVSHCSTCKGRCNMPL